MAAAAGRGVAEGRVEELAMGEEVTSEVLDVSEVLSVVETMLLLAMGVNGCSLGSSSKSDEAEEED